MQCMDACMHVYIYYNNCKKTHVSKCCDPTPEDLKVDDDDDDAADDDDEVLNRFHMADETYNGEHFRLALLHGVMPYLPICNHMLIWFAA